MAAASTRPHKCLQICGHLQGATHSMIVSRGGNVTKGSATNAHPAGASPEAMAQRTRHRTAGSKGPIGMSVGDAVEVCEHLQLLLPLDCIQGSCHPSLVLESLSELPEPRLPIVSGIAVPNS